MFFLNSDTAREVLVDRPKKRPLSKRMNGIAATMIAINLYMKRYSQLRRIDVDAAARAGSWPADHGGVRGRWKGAASPRRSRRRRRQNFSRPLSQRRSRGQRDPGGTPDVARTCFRV